MPSLQAVCLKLQTMHSLVAPVKLRLSQYKAAVLQLAFCPDPVFGLKGLETLKTYNIRPRRSDFQDVVARDYFMQHMHFLGLETTAEIESCVEVRA
jgi:hypothetical protein